MTMGVIYYLTFLGLFNGLSPVKPKLPKLVLFQAKFRKTSAMNPLCSEHIARL
jgi:hypothetical protein